MLMLLMLEEKMASEEKLGRPPSLYPPEAPSRYRRRRRGHQT